MNRALKTAEVRAFFGTEKVFEISEGFLYNCTGKYKPNVSFLLPFQFELDATGKLVNPLTYINDPAVTDSFNLRLDGEASFLFGDFWRSKKGGACFRPKDPQQAKHLLVRVDWGGCFNRSRGQKEGYAEEAGALSFRRASSNGGGSGYDYWVLPVGYVRQYDGEQAFRIDRKLATEYCARHSALQAAERTEADRLLREKLAAEEASRKARVGFLPRLEAVNARLKSIKHYALIDFSGDTAFYYAGRSPRYYTEDEIANMENMAARCVVEHEVAMRNQRAKVIERQNILAQIETFEARFSALGWTLVDRAASHGDCAQFGGVCGKKYYTLTAEGLAGFQRDLEAAECQLVAQRAAQRKAELEVAAKAAGLPSGVRIWHRTGRTNAGCGWVISPEGMERECDEVDTSMHSSSSKRYHQNYEGDHVWRQILPGELVVRWHKACTAAEHKLEVIYRPERVTEAQLERLAELLEEINADWCDCTGLVSKTPSPLIDIEGFLAQFVA